MDKTEFDASGLEIEPPSIEVAEATRSGGGGATARLPAISKPCPKPKNDNVKRTTTKNKAMYPCHPKEKYVCAILIAIVISVRSFTYWKKPSEFEAPLETKNLDDTFERAPSLSSVSRAAKNYCQTDLDILCGRYDAVTSCAQAFGSPMAWLFSAGDSLLTCEPEINDPFVWETLPTGSKNRTELKESPKYRIPLNVRSDSSLHVQYKRSFQENIPNATVARLGLPVDAEGVSDDATHWLSYLFLLSFQRMWDRILPEMFDYEARDNFTLSDPNDPTDRMISFYIHNFMHFFSGLTPLHKWPQRTRERLGPDSLRVFGPSRAMHQNVTSRAWLPDDLFLIMRWALRFRNEHRDIFRPSGELFYEDFLPRISMVINRTQLGHSSWDWSGESHPRFAPSFRSHRDRWFYPFHNFPTHHETVCMSHYSYKMVVITRSCANAIEAASERSNTLEMMGAGFGPIEHFFAFLGNGVLFLLLIFLSFRKKQHFKKLEKGRRRLRQELEDPFLRRALEHKAETELAESEREPFFTNLSLKARANHATPEEESRNENVQGPGSSTWDSEGVASRRIRRDVRIYRIIIIVYIFFATLGFVSLALEGMIMLDRYLEIVLLSLLCFGAPYVFDFDGVQIPSTDC